MNVRLMLTACVALGLAACTTETHSYVVADDACITYGYHVGTPQYRLCTEHEATRAGSGRVLTGDDPVK